MATWGHVIIMSNVEQSFHVSQSEPEILRCYHKHKANGIRPKLRQTTPNSRDLKGMLISVSTGRAVARGKRQGPSHSVYPRQRTVESQCFNWRARCPWKLFFEALRSPRHGTSALEKAGSQNTLSSNLHLGLFHLHSRSSPFTTSKLSGRFALIVAYYPPSIT